MPTLSREQARAVDRLAMQALGIPGIVLMENAGLNALAAIDRFMAERGKEAHRAVIFCGGGNNAGDGYVIARHLHNRGTPVQIIAHKPVEQLTGDAAINASICRNMDVNIQPASAEGALAPVCSGPQPDLLIDALLGTGFTGDLRPALLELIQTINATQKQPNPPVIAAIDLPSGLDCDTGQPPDHPDQDAVRADLTITFVAPKQGFSNPAAQPYLGQVVVADIGTPPELLGQLSSP